MGSDAQRELVHDRFLLLADCQPTDPDGLKVAEEDDVNCKGVWLSVDCAQASAVPILYMHVRIVQSGAGKSDLQDERTNRSGPDTPSRHVTLSGRSPLLRKTRPFMRLPARCLGFKKPVTGPVAAS